MTKKERLTKLLELLYEGNNYSVNDLSKLLGVSEPTIRRDLIQLEEKNKITRLWGGAVVKNNDQNFIDYRLMKYSLNKDKKVEICKQAAKLIKDGYVVYIDAGSTCSYIADYIEASDITVITNGFLNIQALAKKNINTIILGGYIVYEASSIQGIDAINTVKNYNFDVCFLGSTGINKKAGYTTADLNDYALKSQIITKSDQVYICCDSTKIGIKKGYTFASLDEATLITDKENIPDEDKKYLNIYSK